MLPQEIMIQRLRQLCEEDERVVAAMLYGSFARGEADEYSDIDCMLFFAGETAAEVDQEAWVGQIAPVVLYYVNEWGNGVAIFDNLVRGEFHFDPAGAMANLATHQGTVWFPSLDATILVDKTGDLAEHLQPLIGPAPGRDTPEEARFLCHSLLNWTLFGTNVLARGERARALELLRLIHDYLLRMARLLEGNVEHWITPTKAAEQEISAEAYQRLATCTATLDPDSLWAAYRAAWRWGTELMAKLARRHALTLPDPLINKLDRRM